MDLRTLTEAVARGFGSLGQSSPEIGKIWEDTRGWASRFFVSATERWFPFYARNLGCSVHVLRNGVPFPCTGTAVLPCGACGEPACLNHAQVDQHGDGTCYRCIAETITRKRGERMSSPRAEGPHAAPPPPPADMKEATVKRALAALGLKPGASWDEIRRAHRAKAAECHPDLAKNEAERRRFEKKSKLVNGAMADLRAHYPDKAA